MSVKHLTKGSPLPPVDADVLRIYSMRFCPFAERTRLVLAHKNIPHEIVNINLKSKPEWTLERNPSGTVPILEYKGHYIYESAICDEFLEDAFPASAKLLPSDAFQRAAAKLLMAVSDKTTIKIYGIIMADSAEKRQEIIAEYQKNLEGLEKHLAGTGGKFFGGVQVGMADLHMWPFFERIPFINDLTGSDAMPETSFPRLTAWVAAMENVDAVKKCKLPDNLHKQYLTENFISKSEVHYDVGLD